MSLCAVVVTSRFEIDGDGMTVRDVTTADAGRYECKGTEVTVGNTETVPIDVQVVSKYTVRVHCVKYHQYHTVMEVIRCSSTGDEPAT